jgi:hypothetical protein
MGSSFYLDTCFYNDSGGDHFPRTRTLFAGKRSPAEKVGGELNFIGEVWMRRRWDR